MRLPSGRVAVVEVKGLDATQSQQPVESGHRGVVIVGGTQRIPGGEDVARVEAETQPIGLAEAIENRRKLLKAQPKAVPWPAVVSSRRRGEAAGLGMDFIECPGHPAEAGPFAAGGGGPRVGDSKRDPQCLGPAELAMNSSTESRQNRLGAGKIDQVAVVGEGVGDAQTAQRAVPLTRSAVMPARARRSLPEKDLGLAVKICRQSQPLAFARWTALS